jgi:hypothetical protein
MFLNKKLKIQIKELEKNSIASQSIEQNRIE